MTTYVEAWSQTGIQGVDGIVARTAVVAVLTGTDFRPATTGQLWPLTRASAAAE